MNQVRAREVATRVRGRCSAIRLHSSSTPRSTRQSIQSVQRFLSWRAAELEKEAPLWYSHNTVDPEKDHPELNIYDNVLDTGG